MKKLLFLLALVGFLVSCEEPNSAPTIMSLTASKTTVNSEEAIFVWCDATDPDGDPISYRWTCLSGEFLSSPSDVNVMWKAPYTNVETISRVTVQIADAEHGFDSPFSESRAVMLMVNPVERCVAENFGTIVVTNNSTFTLRVMCEREDPSCPECVPIEGTGTVVLRPSESTTFEITPGNIISSCIDEAVFQLGYGGPWTSTVPFPLKQCEVKNTTWVNAGTKSNVQSIIK